MMERYLVPVYMPKSLYTGLREIKRVFIPPSRTAQPEGSPELRIDLSGDRDIEWSYIASRLPIGEGYVLDFGCGYGNMSIHGVQKGHRVLALDLEHNHFPWSHPQLEMVCGDLLKLNLPESAFDFILNCSTVEHVGLSGRYGVAVDETDGDLAAMRKLGQLLKPGGKMLMTIPCGLDAAIVLQGFELQEEIYWLKHSDNRWHVSDRAQALSFAPTGHPTIPTRCSYALGCFVLARPR
jgi:SAM-dependent methyltransferase